MLVNVETNGFDKQKRKHIEWMEDSKLFCSMSNWRFNYSVNFTNFEMNISRKFIPATKEVYHSRKFELQT